MGIMLAINLAVKAATAIWDEWNVTVEEVQGKIDGYSSSLETLNKEYQELNSRNPETLSQSEKDRLQYLKDRIEYEEKLLEIEKARLYKETVGTGFTDYFDKDSLRGKEASLKLFGDGLGEEKSNIGIYENLSKETDELKQKLNELPLYTREYQDVLNTINSNNKTLLKLEDEIISGAGNVFSKMDEAYINAQIAQDAINSGYLTSTEKEEAEYQYQYWTSVAETYEQLYNRMTNATYKAQTTAESISERLGNSLSLEELTSEFSAEELELLATLTFDKNASLDELRTVLADAQKDVDDFSNEMSISYEAIATTAETASESVDTLRNSIKSVTEAFKEQSENGQISVDTMLSLVEAGYATALQFDATTGACTINRDAMLDLVRAKIENQKRDLENLQTDIQTKLKEDGIVAQESANGFYDLAKAKLANASSEQLISMEQFNNATAQINALQNAMKNLDKIGNGTYTTGSPTSTVDDAKKKTKDYIDSYMEFQKKSLENGTIDYNTYCDTVSNLLKSMYKEGKLSAQDYHNYTKLMLESQLSIYDRAISGIAYILDKEVESLEKQKESIESTYKTKIDAIQSEIDLRKKAYEQRKEEDELNDAIYNKERARNQKTNLQFVNGQMIYTSDGTAIKDAEEVLADKKHEMEVSRLESQIKSLEKAMESEIETIDKEIKKYEEYKKQIQDVAKEYENAENVKYALAVTGLNNEAEILQCRTDVLNTFKDNYIAIQQAIADAAWESANEQIKAAQEAQKGADGNLGDSRKIEPLPPQETITTTKGAGNNKNLTGQHHTITKYAKGTENAKRGLNLVGEDGMEAYFDNDGNASLVTKPTLIPMEGGETVKSASETKELLNKDNLVSLADILTGKVPLMIKRNEEVLLAKPQQTDFMKALMQNPIIPNVSMPKYDYTKLGNRNDNSVTMNGDINITCPGVTSQEVVRQVDAALRHEFFGMANKAKQRVNITR